MSTRSTISILRIDNTIESSFAHWDGYMSHNGAILFLHYSDPEKVKSLISFGSVSTLAKEVFPKGKHSYDNREENITVFYGRDRGETDCQSSKFDNISDFVKNNDFQEFDYTYKEKNNKWYLFEPSTLTFKPLRGLVKKEFKNLQSELKSDFLTFEKELKIKKQYKLLSEEIKVNETTQMKLKL